MNDKTPELFELADLLEDGAGGWDTPISAARELRRQHARIEALERVLQALVDEYEPNIKTFAFNAPRKAKWQAAIDALSTTQQED